ncbi:MAG: dehydrogenase [Gammaproteobacteria bacterium]|nr:dehydrogenase [Gammaproteobacteria bacterium]
MMKQPVTDLPARGICLDLYRTMVRVAAADDAIKRGLSAGDIQFQYYPCGGQEAIAAGIATTLSDEDYLLTTYRGIHDIVAKGTPMREIMAELYGRMSGTSKGKGGPMHLSDPSAGLMMTTGIVGSGLPVANGLALAAAMRGEDRVTAVCFGDGASSIGAFHEALNLAALWNLPVIFICQNNQYAEYTALQDYTRNKDIAGRAAAYSMQGEQVDGTDPVAMMEALTAAATRARGGDGPTLVEAVCHRLQGHAFGGELTHMDQEALATALENAPLPTFRQRLLSAGVVEERELDGIDTAARAEVDDAISFALSDKPPDREELFIDVFADAEQIPGQRAGTTISAPEPAGETRNMTFGATINHTLDLALGQDDSVFLLGEDIHDPAGGVVKATAGLSTRYGLDRVRPTPIAEQAIVGAALGASMAGMRPVAEIMINDFLAVCMDQVANHAAKLRYMSGGRTGAPLTIRTMTAGNVGSFGAQHSQSLEAWLTHSPGLKVVYPSTPAEAKGLLLSCIYDDDPCIFFESMRLYFNSGPVPDGDYRIPLGTADVKRPGADLTILCYGWMVPEALAAADALKDEEIDAEVLDLRTLVPLDQEAILASVARTGRAVIAHSAVEFCGFGAELASLIHRNLHNELKAPVARIGAAYAPVPFARELEEPYFPDANRIKIAAAGLFTD